MSYFNMVCDSCGREVYGCNIVNGMKFCAKCYQETFGETDKDRKIAELQKQLAEKDKYTYTGKEVGEIERKYETQLAEKEKQITELQKQLAEKDEEIEELNDKLEWKSKWLKIADNMVGHYEKSNQDKISFAIEQLEKVKMYIDDHAYYIDEREFGIEINEYIDNQINELKGRS